MIDPNALADDLDRKVGRDQFVMIDRAELIVVLAALRLYGAAQQPLDSSNSRPSHACVYRADGTVEHHPTAPRLGWFGP